MCSDMPHCLSLALANHCNFSYHIIIIAFIIIMINTIIINMFIIIITVINGSGMFSCIIFIGMMA